DGFTANQTQLRQPGRSAVPIRVLTAGAGRRTPDELSRLAVAGARGPVELGQFASLRDARIATRIQRIDRSRAITIGANAGQGALVGDVQGAIERPIGRIAMPSGYRVAY